MELIKAIMPVIVMLLIGMILRKRKAITDKGIEGLQLLVMNVMLPTALFSNFYKTSLNASELIFPLTMFVVVVAGIFLGKLICRLCHEEDKTLPFMLSGYEAGMLGFALMAILAGNIKTFAMLDIGHDFAIFTVYLAMLKMENGQKQNIKDALIGIITTPVLVGIILGIIFGVTGIGTAIGETALGPVIDAVCDFVSAPTSAVILVVIGYRMYFKGLKWNRVLKVAGIRIAMQIVFATIILIIYKIVGGELTSKLAIQSLVLMLILPPPFILPLYVDGEEKREFYSSELSFYTLITIVGFIIMLAIR